MHGARIELFPYSKICKNNSQDSFKSCAHLSRNDFPLFQGASIDNVVSKNLEQKGQEAR